MKPIAGIALAAILSAGFVLGVQHGDRPAPHAAGSRSPVLAMNGVVATSQPLASAAALRVMQEGGNAVDAAITAAAVLNVVEPMMTGIGGDMFALVYMKSEGKVVGLDGSGWSGSKATLDTFRQKSLKDIPGSGILSVSVPGAVAGWYKLHGRYGKLPMKRLLAPAIEYAERGYPVSEIISRQWQPSAARLRATPEAAKAFLIDGRAPQHGDIFKVPDLARSFRAIADGGRDAFYKGEIARAIVQYSDKMGGLLTLADFSDYDAEWVQPLSTNYRGYDIYEVGPATQGMAVLQMMNILEGFDLKSLGHNTPEYLHLLIEAKRLAFADRDAYIADPRKAKVPVDRLISKEYAAERRKLIDPNRTNPELKAGATEFGDTVYLAVADGEGNMISFINSVFGYFGSGLVAGDTGIVLQNRGSLFELDPNHPNRVEPRKRPFHTLIPAMVLKDGKPWYSFGVMSGDMQAQGHAQVLVNAIDFGMDVQQAGEAPRFRHSAQGVALESAISGNVRYLLSQKGHRIIDQFDAFGGYQGVRIDPRTGALWGGSDPRKDGLAIGW